MIIDQELFFWKADKFHVHKIKVLKALRMQSHWNYQERIENCCIYD